MSIWGKDIAHCPEAQEAIRKEAEGLPKLKTWDEDSHCEKGDLISWYIGTCIRIIFGYLLILGSIQFYVRAQQFWKFKGRICYRGDSAKDQIGA